MTLKKNRNARRAAEKRQKINENRTGKARDAKAWGKGRIAYIEV
jgi:hypothetical protein